MQSDYFEVLIPHLPPGINQTYRIVKRNGKAGLAKTRAANRWDRDAALIVGAAAGRFEFEPDLTAEYQIIVRWWGGKHDADAHLKLVQDCVTRKLGFDDRQIIDCVTQRCPADWGAEDDEPVGVQIHLFKAIERDWVSSLILERLGILDLQGFPNDVLELMLTKLED
jgi:Holliday junction resolvase RusA-like endonuclease